MLLVSSVGVPQFNSLLHYQEIASDPTGRVQSHKPALLHPQLRMPVSRTCASDQSEVLGTPSLHLVNILQQLTDPRNAVSLLFTSVIKGDNKGYRWRRDAGKECGEGSKASRCTEVPAPPRGQQPSPLWTFMKASSRRHD